MQRAAGSYRRVGSRRRPRRSSSSPGASAGDDRIALEVSGNAFEIARIIEPHVAQVLIVSGADTGIRQARAKTDRLDARALAKLLATGSLEGLWRPDEETRALRRRLSRRQQLLRARTRAKNEVHAALMRRLITRPKVSDLFGQAGREWLASLELPSEERETVTSSLRQIDFLTEEIEQVERVIAEAALRSPEAKRLMSVPGVNVVCAASFMAAVGDIARFSSQRKLTGYLGLDPRVRQSGASPAAHGHSSKQGSRQARWALVEAAISVARQPGPLRAFYQRIRSRRGHQVAVVAVARKLACLFWCLLTRGEDYAYAQPSLTKKKLRRLELKAGAPKGEVERGLWSTNKAMRKAEREHARQGERAYERTVADWHAVAQPKAGADATPGRASSRPSKRQAARQDIGPKPRALARPRPPPRALLQAGAQKSRRT